MAVINGTRHRRPSLDARLLSNGLYDQAAQLGDDSEAARQLRKAAHQAHLNAGRAALYEDAVDLVVLAGLDLIDGGGFEGTVDDAKAALRRAITYLRQEAGQ